MLLIVWICTQYPQQAILRVPEVKLGNTAGNQGVLSMSSPVLPPYEPLGGVPVDRFNLVYIIFYIQASVGPLLVM